MPTTTTAAAWLLVCGRLLDLDDVRGRLLDLDDVRGRLLDLDDVRGRLLDLVGDRGRERDWSIEQVSDLLVYQMFQFPNFRQTGVHLPGCVPPLSASHQRYLTHEFHQFIKGIHV